MFGLSSSQPFNPATDIPDLDGKVILVTGGNTGLGLETIRQLALHRPRHIYLAARTASKAASAIDSIHATNPSAQISHLPLDLTSLESIRACAASFNAKSTRLDLLINNAGIMFAPYSQTADNYEIQFGTNHVGHFALTKLLLPALLRTAEESGSDVRVINLSSMGLFLSYMCPGSKGLLLDQSQAEKTNTYARYGSAKLANALHAQALAERYPSITATSVHPGVIDTELFAHTKGLFDRIPGARGVVDWVIGKCFQTVETGARNTLWAATAEKKAVREGFFWTPVGKRSDGFRCVFASRANAQRLWDWSEKEMEKHGI